MYYNDDVLINKLYIDGINNPKIRLEGLFNDLSKLKANVDGKEYKLNIFNVLDTEYVYNRILKKNQNKFNLVANIPKKSKKLELYYNNKLLLTKNISYKCRIKNRLGLKFTNFFKIISRFPKILKKVIKLMWQRHHFLLPPRLVKQYMGSFVNNLGSKNVDELFYNPLVDSDYRKWLDENRQPVKLRKLNYNPLISIIMPTYNVSSKLLSDCLDSILNQSYTNFEICIADDNSTNSETINTLKKYEKFKQINVVYRKKNGHISEASNTALSMAKGAFVALIDNDDVLDKNALYYMVESLNQDQTIDMIYTDEDKLDLSGKRCFPHFKPDFSLDTLLSSNYICHFTMIRKKIVDDIGGFRSEYNGAQDYDLFLRVIEKTNRIHHISKILYHWRMTENSTSTTGSNKSYAYIAGKKALEDYFRRNRLNATVSLIGNPQMYQINYLLDKEPRISVIIPTKNKSNILKKCLESIYNRTNYHNFEIIVIDNGSDEKEIVDLLETYKKEYDNFKSYRLECEFNYSYINNYAVSKSDGEYIVLLNNDTEIITSDWLNDMVGYAMQEHIGCVGAKLLYPNKTVQHCGVVTGVGGIAMHANVATGEDNYGYFGRLVSVYDWSCVTAACLMIKKDKFNLVGGLDEKLKVAYNDVDLNLKLIDKGYNNVVLPQVKLFHYESLSRGNDMSNTQKERFTYEINYMCDKWKTKLLRDPFYNINFSHTYAFRLDKKVDDYE